MGEVYAVPGAPAPTSAYPVRHEYVGTVAIPSFYMKPHGRRALSGGAAAIEDRRSQEDRGQFVPLPRPLKIDNQHGFLPGDRVLIQVCGAEFWLWVFP